MNYQMSQYNQLTLYIEYANQTSVTLSGEEAFTYFYDKISMDIYTKQQSNLEATNRKIEANIRLLLSWLAFYVFWRMLLYFVKLLFVPSKSKPVRIILNKYR